MVEGFRSLIEPGDLQHIRIDELQLLLGGSEQVEIEDIAKDVQLQGGFVEDSPQVKVLAIHSIVQYFLCFYNCREIACAYDIC
jgi:hypothetical protein